MRIKKYKIVHQEKREIKIKYIETLDIETEVLPKNIIEIKRVGLNLTLNSFETIKEKDLISRFYELSLMLNSNLLFDDALSILIKNEKNTKMKEFLESLKNSFINSKDINKTLENYKINPLIKSFLKITQDSGNISSNIEALSKIISENHKIKKEFKKAMTYPIILVVTFFLALIGIFKLVVPNFESIFSNSKMVLPFATKALLFTKDIFDNYLLTSFSIIFLLLFFLVFLYKKNHSFRFFLDKVLVNHAFFISDLYKLKTLYNYLVVVDILLQNKYEFLESISKSKVLLNNKFLLARITQIEKLLKNGKSIRFAFESTELFDDVTLSLINTGEVTNSLDTVIYEIKKIYKIRFDDKLKLFTILIEPLFFIIIMALIIWIILAIFVPLWSMNDMLKF